ncbi:MAG: acetyl-CoA carboxylase carboxyltransferase subunit alpha [Nitrospirae bacterium]|nr:acetyl-CoA carboxylase carboxyltransferase subunit alpha [Nitrospirota bacterium]
MTLHYLPFESDIEETERKLHDLELAAPGYPNAPAKDIQHLRERLQRQLRDVYENLTPWQKTLVARHPDRPQAQDYVAEICDEFVEMHGDRLFGDDFSIVGGLARIGDQPLVVVGQQKGRTTKEKTQRNFGMPQPEGYRKALRLFRIAERFRKPILTLVDTPGAYPGVGAEERGQAEAIARNILEMLALKVPIVTVVIGEGGSGGALALAAGDRLLMMEHAVYSVISPEACVAILWKDGESPDRAASELKLTAGDLQRLGVADEILPEPPGGAHRDPAAVARTVKEAVLRHLSALRERPFEALARERQDRFRRVGDTLVNPPS